MTRHALLDIDVSRRDENICSVEMRYDRPGDSRLGKRSFGDVALNLRALFAHRHNRQAYGQALIDALLASPELRDALRDAYKDGLDNFEALRIRLHVNASPLHSVRWETLTDPEDRSRWLLTNERVLFSRFVAPERRPAIPLRGADTMRVLIVVANPPDLKGGAFRDDDRVLDSIDVEGEVERIRTAIQPVVAEVLATTAASPAATSVRSITAKLAEDFDVLYLVCHGALLRETPQAGPESVLYLGSDDGKSPAVLGASFVAALADLGVLPRLVVLVSCQSAGTGELPRTGDPHGAMAALAPALARIGVPAVLAMQGSVAMSTMAVFMPRFFTELMKDGQIDRAVAVARAAVREEPDGWMPTLYLQTTDGRLWAAPGAHVALTGFDKWPRLIEAIDAGDCTAVVGAGLFDSTLVPQRQIARRWAREEGLPFVEHGRDDMPHVAQFVATMHEPAMLRRRWMETLEAELRHSHGGLVESDEMDLSQLVSAIGKARRQMAGNSPHQILAKLPFRIYVVTTPDDLLTDALVEAGRRPVVEIFRWHSGLEGLPTIYDTKPRYRPTRDSPLVYHLHGRLKYPKSLVLTEDEYLEYLTRIKSREVSDSAMTSVEAALKEQPLLLLGFQFDDWDFRVLFRSISASERARRTGAGLPPSVAVQFTPDDRFLQPKLVQTYLEKYFGVANVDLSWGSTEAFLTELWRQWSAAGGGRHG